MISYRFTFTLGGEIPQNATNQPVKPVEEVAEPRLNRTNEDKQYKPLVEPDPQGVSLSCKLGEL